MTLAEAALVRRIYELERQLPERNYAKDHSFEEWLEYRLSCTTWSAPVASNPSHTEG